MIVTRIVFFMDLQSNCGYVVTRRVHGVPARVPRVVQRGGRAARAAPAAHGPQVCTLHAAATIYRCYYHITRYCY